MSFDALTDSSTPAISRRFTYESDGSDVGQSRTTNSRNNKNPISISLPLAVSERFGAFDMRESLPAVVSDQLKMILLTNKGERVGNYDFGANVRQILFESNADEMEDILAQSIQENVSKYMPGVRLTEMTIFTPDQVSDLQDHEVLFRLGFKVDALNLLSRIELVIGAG